MDFFSAGVNRRAQPFLRSPSSSRPIDTRSVIEPLCICQKNLRHRVSCPSWTSLPRLAFSWL